MKKVFAVAVILLTILSGVAAASGGDPRPKSKPSSSRPSGPSHKPEHRRPPEHHKPPKHSKPPKKSSSSDVIDDCGDIFVMLSVLNNMLVTFDNYPYANSSSYIELNQEHPNKQFYRFTADSSGFYSILNPGLGADVRLEGFAWKFVGPVIENRFYNKLEDNSKYGKLNLGLQFAVFQFYPCSFILDVKWEHLYGKYFADGVNLGISFKSYPVKPLILEYRAEWGIFGNSASEPDKTTGITKNATFKSHLEAGAMTGIPVEIYGFWDYTMDGFIGQKEHSIGIGAKYHF